MATGCVYCDGEGGQRLWRDERCRVVLTDEPFPGFSRVIWNTHVREMTDLDPTDRLHFVGVAFAVESGLRTLLAPTKMNLASLGNVVPHLHWHVIPRFSDDTHFPAPVWAAPRRPAPVRELPAGFEAALAADLARTLGPGLGTPRE